MASTLDAGSSGLPPESTQNLSWLGLVARTAFGGMEVAQLRAEVSVERAPRSGVDGLRLIVQSYPPEALDSERRPRRYARPIASLQRMVSPTELEAGVQVDLLQLDANSDEVVIVAWIENGDAHLDYDARAARPSLECWYGEGVAEPDALSRVRLTERSL